MRIDGVGVLLESLRQSHQAMLGDCVGVFSEPGVVFLFADSCLDSWQGVDLFVDGKLCESALSRFESRCYQVWGDLSYVEAWLLGLATAYE